jgi:hypothetical protein
VTSSELCGTQQQGRCERKLSQLGVATTETGVFSRSWTCHGENQEPCSLDGRMAWVSITQGLEAHRQDLPGDDESTQGIERRSSLPLYAPTEDFLLGGCKVLRRSDHDRVGIVAAVITVHEALKAYDQLCALGLMRRIIDLYSIKPVDRAKQRASALGLASGGGSSSRRRPGRCLRRDRCTDDAPARSTQHARLSDARGAA